MKANKKTLNNGRYLRAAECQYSIKEGQAATFPETNADRIRNMTDEELAEFIQENLSCNCGSCFLEEKCMGTRKCCYEIYLEWLQSPVEVRE